MCGRDCRPLAFTACVGLLCGCRTVRTMFATLHFACELGVVYAPEFRAVLILCLFPGKVRRRRGEPGGPVVRVTVVAVVLFACSRHTVGRG